MKHIFNTPLRRIIQTAVIVIIIIFSYNFFNLGKGSNPETYCPFGGIQAISTYSINTSLACDMTTVQISMGIILILSIIIMGKIFCSYLCPLGFLSELLIKLRNYCKIKAINIKERSVFDIILRSFKYFLLFITFYISITSSELFCKKFDPYYALTTGFNGELNMYLSLAAVYLLIIGSVFINMFWCRYICPLGAINNLFKYFLTALGILIIYSVLVLLGIKLSWIILLTIICLAGYISEIIYNKPKIFPLLTVRRDPDKCNDCSDCLKRCPYNIPVNEALIIKHVDCTLCGECIHSCKSNALSINNRKWIKWFIPLIILVLFLSGIIVSNKWEIPMVNLKWGGSDTLKLESVEIKGLRSVKCYASSMNFVKKAQNVEGVYGVQTFIQHHRAELLYNPAETCVDSIKKAIYTPVRFKISQPGKDVRQIKVITLHTENMTDPIDVNYLGMQLRTEKKRYYGLTSEYSEPLTLRLYIDITEPVDVNYIRKIIEMREQTIQMHGGKTQKVKVDFKFIDASPQIDTITKRTMLELLFRPYKKIFKEETTDLHLAEHYDIVYPDIEKPLVARNLPYLSNYLSQAEGILGVETLLNSDDEPTIRIYFTKESTNKETIQSLLSRKKWTIKTKEGNLKEIEASVSM